MDRSSAETLMQLYARLRELLDEASEQIEALQNSEERERLACSLGAVFGRLRRDLWLPIVTEHPELDPDREIPNPMPPMTKEELERVAQLTDAEIGQLDEALVSEASPRWRKVARVVSFAMNQETHVAGVPDLYYAQRVRELVAAGRLEAQGNLGDMRFSEVRLPEPVEPIDRAQRSEA